MNRNVSGTLSKYDMLSVRDGCFQVLVGNPISPMQAIVRRSLDWSRAAGSSSV